MTDLCSSMITDGVNGLLVPPRDPAELALAMNTLLESPELARRLGEAAREKVVREYSLERLLRRTEDLYTSLLERRVTGVQYSSRCRSA
jgi:glycosyltransferase involved in cell wall biosynthesis